MDWTWGWTAVGAIATSVLAGGIGFAAWQIIETRKSTRKNTSAQVAVELFKELRAREAIEKLRSIYNLPYDLSRVESINSLTDEERENIDYILDRFDFLAVLVDEGIIDERLAVDAYAGVVVLRCWYKLHQYIKNVRDERGYFGDNVEAFTRRSLDYFMNKGIKVKYYTKGQKDKAIDLINALNKKDLHPRSMDDIIKDRKSIMKSEL